MFALHSPRHIAVILCRYVDCKTNDHGWGNSGKATKVRTKVRREAAMSGNML